MMQNKATILTFMAIYQKPAIRKLNSAEFFSIIALLNESGK